LNPAASRAYSASPPGDSGAVCACKARFRMCHSPTTRRIRGPPGDRRAACTLLEERWGAGGDAAGATEAQMITKRALVLGIAAGAMSILLGARPAQAGGRHGWHGHVGVGIGYPYWGYGPYWGGWGPWE